MKKNFLKKFLSMMIVSLLSLSLFAFTGCKIESKNNVTTGHIDISSLQSQGISLKSSTVTLSDNYLEQTLTATVTSSGVIANELNWNIYWADSNVTENISTYLTIEPKAEENNVASIKCFKNFEDYGQAVVKVYSVKDTNVYATCVVNYVGEPTSFKIFKEDTDISHTQIYINEGDFVYFDLVLENLLGVGKKYNDFSVYFQIQGNFKVNCKTYNLAGGIVDERDVMCTSSGSKTFSYETSSGNMTVDLSEFLNFDNYFNWAIDGSRLVLSSQKVIGNLFNGENGEENFDGNTIPDSGVKATLIDYDLNFYIEVKENTSGLKELFSIYVTPDLSVLSPQSITLDKTKIEF